MKSKKPKMLKLYKAVLEKKCPVFLREEERNFGGFLKMKYKVIVAEEEKHGASYHPRLYAWKIK